MERSQEGTVPAVFPGNATVSGTNGMKISDSLARNTGFSEQKGMFWYAPMP